MAAFISAGDSDEKRASLAKRVKYSQVSEISSAVAAPQVSELSCARST